jgi:hypothetical protein
MRNPESEPEALATHEAVFSQTREEAATQQLIQNRDR